MVRYLPALVVLFLAACGSQKGGTNVVTNQLAVAAHPKSKPVATTGSDPKLADIVHALSQIAYCKTLAEQPAAVQELLSAPTTKVWPNTNPSLAYTHNTTYTNSERVFDTDQTPHFDGTDYITWAVSVGGDVVQSQWVVDLRINDDPEVGIFNPCLSN